MPSGPAGGSSGEKPAASTSASAVGNAALMDGTSPPRASLSTSWRQASNQSPSSQSCQSASGMRNELPVSASTTSTSSTYCEGFTLTSTDSSRRASPQNW